MANQDSEESSHRTVESIDHHDEVDSVAPVAGESLAPTDGKVEVIEPAPAPRRRIVFQASWISIAIWAVLIVLLVAFFAFGSVTIYPKDGLERTMRVDQIWALFRNDLPDVAHQSLLSIFFYVAIALVVIGIAWMLFLSIGTRTVTESEEAAATGPNDPVSPRF